MYFRKNKYVEIHGKVRYEGGHRKYFVTYAREIKDYNQIVEHGLHVVYETRMRSRQLMKNKKKKETEITNEYVFVEDLDVQEPVDNKNK